MQLEIFRQMSPAQKISLVHQATEASKALSIAGLRHRFPKAGPSELRYRFVELLYGNELAAKAYGRVDE